MFINYASITSLKFMWNMERNLEAKRTDGLSVQFLQYQIFVTGSNYNNINNVKN